MEIANGALAGCARPTGGNLLGQVVLIFDHNKRNCELFPAPVCATPRILSARRRAYRL